MVAASVRAVASVAATLACECVTKDLGCVSGTVEVLGRERRRMRVVGHRGGDECLRRRVQLASYLARPVELVRSPAAALRLISSDCIVVLIRRGKWGVVMIDRERRLRVPSREGKLPRVVPFHRQERLDADGRAPDRDPASVDEPVCGMRRFESDDDLTSISGQDGYSVDWTKVGKQVLNGGRVWEGFRVLRASSADHWVRRL